MAGRKFAPGNQGNAMLKTASLVLAAAFALAALAPRAAVAAGAGGTSARAWVSSLGGDAAGCGTVAAPCRTFQYTHDSVVRPGGTIYVKDAGNYVTSVPFTITHAISIINDGVGAATIVAPGADAIDIQAGANDAILIKGLILDGAGSGINGVNVTSAGSLTMTNCLIKGFAFVAGNFESGTGVLIAPTSGAVSFAISDTIISGNGYIGIYTYNSGGTSSGAIRNVQAINNHNGLDLEAPSSSVTVVDSVFSQNSFGGIAVANNSGSLSVSNSVATGNGQYDVGQFGGTLTSFQNNIYNTTTGTITRGALH
jgi:hypothetical protein